MCGYQRLADILSYPNAQGSGDAEDTILEGVTRSSVIQVSTSPNRRELENTGR